MRIRKKPKVFARHSIQFGGKEIGYIQLVEYYTQCNHCHIEYKIYDKWQNNRIMSYELPKYLKECKAEGNINLVAIVHKDNLPSIKLLQKNGFIKLTDIGDEMSYVINLDVTQEDIKRVMEKLKEGK